MKEEFNDIATCEDSMAKYFDTFFHINSIVISKTHHHRLGKKGKWNSEK